jgi:RIO-like serine/threonine protein kinase
MQETLRPPPAPAPEILKQDLFGNIVLARGADGPEVRRDTRSARWWTAWLARRLAGREARALAAAAAVPDVPRLISWDGRVLVRSWLEGRPMHQARPTDPAYFCAALALVRRLHTAGVVHNDLAKEPNWLVLPDGRPGLVDFQLAWAPRRRGPMFRVLGREDLRHALKHKRWYCAQALSGRERALLARRGWPSRLWMATGKKAYLFVTRRLLGWSDREGAGDRG